MSDFSDIQYEALKKQIEIMQHTMDIRFAEWSDDRKTITDLEVRLKTVEAKVDGARDDIQASTKKTINRVDEHLAPVPQMIATQVKAEMNKKSVIEKIAEKVNG